MKSPVDHCPSLLRALPLDGGLTARRRISIQHLAALCLMLVLCLVPVCEGRGQQTAGQWIESLRLMDIPLDDPADRQPPAVVQLTFVPGSTTPTPSTVKTLNALASALTSPGYYRHYFEIAWYVDPNQKPAAPGQALAPRRAATLYELLQAKPGISPWRVMLRQSRKRPDGLNAEIEPDSLTIIVNNLGL